MASPARCCQRPDSTQKELNGHLAGLRRYHHVKRQHAILIAALDDVAGRDEHVLVGRDVLDGKLIDVLGLVNDDFLLLQGFVECEEAAVLEQILAVDQKDRQVALRVGTG